MEKKFKIVVDYINETITDHDNVFKVGNMGYYNPTKNCQNYREILKITKTHVWFKTIFIDMPDKVTILNFSKVNFENPFLTKAYIYVLNDEEIDDIYIVKDLNYLNYEAN